MKNKLLLLFAALIFTSTLTIAEGDKTFNLSPIDGKLVDITKTINIYGKCGTSVVAILGVDAEEYHQFGSLKFDTSGAPDIQLRNNGKNVSFKNLLSDRNVMNCISTKFGHKILIGSNCGGSACGDNLSYYLIDTKNGNITSSNVSKKICDERCINQLLGFKYFK